MKQNMYSGDWNLLMQFFPEGWSEKAKQLGALTRQRKFKSAGDVLRLLLIHLADGCSMRETSVRATQGSIVSVSDVALLKKLRASAEWLRWMAVEMLKKKGISIVPPDWLCDYEVRSVDASVITEPGSTGTDWRLHYSLKLFNLQCDQFIISDPYTGESFVNFQVCKRDLLIGDRAYGRLRGLEYVNKKGGHFIARLKNKAFKVYNQYDRELNLLEVVKDLRIGEILNLQIHAGKTLKLPMRLCAVKKSEEEANKAIVKAKNKASKNGRRINSETLELHRYILLVTSLPENITAKQIAWLYRTRWQIEIAFKRLKSIMGLGHLPKKDEASARAWMHGKLFVALLVQAIIDEGRLFSPWGYPIRGC